MWIKEEFNKAYASWLITRNETSCADVIDLAVLWSASWIAEKAAQEICPHKGKQKVVHRFCCEHAQKIRQLSKELTGEK